MLNRTNLARVVLVSITGLWFGWPVLAVMLENGLGVRHLVGAVSSWPSLAFSIMVTSLALAARIYPTREGDSDALTVMPFVCAALCLCGFWWLDAESVVGILPGLLTLIGCGLLCLFSLASSLKLWPSQHRLLLFGAPAAVGIAALVGPLLQRLEWARDERCGDQIVAALDSFHDREGVYPDSLAGLVPQDLTEIPRPNRWFWLAPNFHYEVSGAIDPDRGPIAYELAHLRRGYEALEESSRSQDGERTSTGYFRSDPQFDLPVPARWRLHER